MKHTAKHVAFLLFLMILLPAFSACGGGSGSASIPERADPSLPAAATTAPPAALPIHASPVDFNHNGTDDYTDILQGARIDANNKPRYDPSYFSEGYPPEDAGVCTDLVWRAFQHAGYDLKAMIDKDIAANTAEYWRVEGSADRNIDFRRVPNLQVFFQRYAQTLTTDLTQIEAWQPGDIVTFGIWHIAIVSDTLGESGLPCILHNMGQSERENDQLSGWGVGGDKGISGHFRWDASRVDPDLLIAFAD